MAFRKRVLLLMSLLFLLENVFFILKYVLNIEDKKETILLNSKNSNNNNSKWANTPSFTLLCRTYSGTAMELYNILIVSYLLFWPFNEWQNSELTLVFDDEKDLDHRFATILANLPPYPNVFFEKYPRKKQTFCSDWRGEGYSRQQYSNFYADLYTSNDYIGLLDSDTVFICFLFKFI